MSNFRDTLDELFVTKLGYEFVGDALPKPDVAGKENIIAISKEYTFAGVAVVAVECKDRIAEFQKKVISFHKQLFPNAYFIFISNQGKVFDLYNHSTSKKLKPITYDEIGRNTRLFKEKIQFFDVEAAEGVIDLRIKIDKAFETNDKITKKFYDKFKGIHDKLQKAISGIDSKDDKAWYASVMLNRFMFIYFLQKHNAIQNDPNFLLTKFEEVARTGKDYYQDFLLPLFFLGFAKRDNHAEKQAFTQKYGYVKYLNGGLFYPHTIEVKYAKIKVYSAQNDKVFADTVEPAINVDADIIKEILTFLNGYTWYLQTGRSRNENEIDPDVLGYIFEKYINQKELGAYYTKEDITGYIARNCIVPYIIDRLAAPSAPRGGTSFTLPLNSAELITQNADIEQIFLDYLEELDDYETLKFLYKDVLLNLSVLDPSVGSGAFLFAALNVLLPIYQKVIFKLRAFKNPPNRGGQGGVQDEWLQDLIATLNAHSEEYYLTKQIILNNLYGVDIVQEATEICKLRLFLQLVSHLHDVNDIEPLPDIDFNIYAGNSLVGGLSWADLQGNYGMKLFDKDGKALNIDLIKANINLLADLKKNYRNLQQTLTNNHEETELKSIKDQIIRLENTINDSIDIGVSNPFHWFIEYSDIFERGGFDVIIGNPPYVEYSKVKEYELKGYRTLKCGNLYANFIERINGISIPNCYTGLIIPISFSCTKRMELAQNIIKENAKSVWVSHFGERPSKLFEGAEVLLNIIFYQKAKSPSIKYYSTEFIKWFSQDRPNLLKSFRYNEVTKIRTYVIPKFGKAIENNIWEKINKNVSLGQSLLDKSSHKTYYRIGGGRYWKIFTDFQPRFTLNGQAGVSSRENYLYLKNEDFKYTTICSLSSSLFYWYFIITTNCRDLNPSDLQAFPLDLEKIDSIKIQKLNKLGNELMTDYKNTSRIKAKISQKTGNVEYQEFYPRKSKPIIDEIDKLLAEHYGFTAAETAFIINYDLRFRMGSEEEAEEE